VCCEQIFTIRNCAQEIGGEELAITELGLRTLRTIKFPTFDSSGVLTGLGAIVSDVTDIRNAEQELRQSQRMGAIVFWYATTYGEIDAPA